MLTQHLAGVQSPPDWQEILQNFRGSELQNYFTRILEDDLTATVKPQYVDNIPKAIRSAIAPAATSSYSIIYPSLLQQAGQQISVATMMSEDTR